MIISLEWLRDFVDIHEDPHELSNILSDIGLEAEQTDSTIDILGVVIAKVESTEKHPNADKLKVCILNDGSDKHQVICGAPNVQAGQIVPLAKIGSILPGDFKIKKVEIRGVESNGMICSEQELRISEDHDGIMVLPNNLALGQDFKSAYGYKFDSLEIDITPNRSDAFSHYGVARDIACATERKLKEIKTKFIPQNNGLTIPISTESIEDCPRYIGGIIKNITVGPSPDWLVKKLKFAGHRSINNVVDISNYVMLEMGHPTHIFDYNKISNKEILIRRAKKNEPITTLDGQNFKLNKENLVITDGKNPIALAGIMGGKDSSINENTTEVFVESAYFNPITIRKGSKILSLLTDASKRFERGADPNGCLDAFCRVVSLLKELTGGEFISEIMDFYPNPIKELNVPLRHSELISVLGCNIEKQRIQKILGGLKISYKLKNDIYHCTIPSFRPDLTREIDLIEEIIRIYGISSIPSAISLNGVIQYGNPDPESYLNTIKDSFCAFGFHQLFLNSLNNETEANSTKKASIPMLNPLNIEMSNLRTSLLPGLLKSADYNIKHGNLNFRLFEIGQIHYIDLSLEKKYIENKFISGIIHGNEKDASITLKEKKEDLLNIKGFIISIFKNRLKMNLKFNNGKHPAFESSKKIIINNIDVGFLGKINYKWIKTLKLNQNTIYGFELNLSPIKNMMVKKKKFKKINTYPIVQRDLNFVMKENLEAGNIISLILKIGKGYIIKVDPLNLFIDEKVLGKNKKSITFSIFFQHPSKTLEDKEVNSIIDEIINIADKQFSAKLRT